MYGKKNMGYTNFLEGMFQYFHDKVIPNLLKLMSSPRINKYKNLASLIKDEERAESRNTLASRKNQIIIKYNDGLITKQYFPRRHDILCLFKHYDQLVPLAWFSGMKPEKN